MTFKSCTICKVSKSLDLFNKRGGQEKGYRSFCKTCQADKDAKRYNPEKRRQQYLSKHDEEKELRKEYYSRNKDKYYINKTNRRAQALKATPLWFDEFDSFVLSEAYSLCRSRLECTGLKWEVDHIVPLQGENVCGLHWHKNWRVITQFDNRSKGNRYEY